MNHLMPARREGTAQGNRKRMAGVVVNNNSHCKGGATEAGITA